MELVYISFNLIYLTLICICKATVQLHMAIFNEFQYLLNRRWTIIQQMHISFSVPLAVI